MVGTVLSLIFVLTTSLHGGISADSSLLRKHVEFLCSIDPPRNYSHVGSLDSAAHYIASELGSYGYPVSEQKYQVRGVEYKNIATELGRGGDSPPVVVGAHYDVLANLPGADDNASGVAGLLELARLLKSGPALLRSKVVLVFFTLEEPPHFNTRFMGSYVHASALADSGTQIDLMICLEMIGYFTEEPNSQRYPVWGMGLFYPRRGNYIAVVGDYRTSRQVKELSRIYRRDVGLNSSYLVSPRWVPGISFSDHRNYWGYGYRALMVTDGAFYRNENYHTPDDVPGALDYGKMAQVVDGVLVFLRNGGRRR